MHLRRTLYRGINPYWADYSLAGQEAARVGGRFNRRGRPALYLSFDPITALDEAKQVGTHAPVEMFTIEVNLARVLDSTDPSQLSGYGTRPSDLADNTWAMTMDRDGIAPTQALAERVIEAGFSAMIVPSFAPSSLMGAQNLVIWSSDFGWIEVSEG